MAYTVTVDVLGMTTDGLPREKWQAKTFLFHNASTTDVAVNTKLSIDNTSETVFCKPPSRTPITQAYRERHV